MLCVQLVGDSTVLKKAVARYKLRKLELHGGSTTLLLLLNVVKYSKSIKYLEVGREPFTTCLHVTILYHVRILYRGLYMYGLGYFVITQILLIQ